MHLCPVETGRTKSCFYTETQRREQKKQWKVESEGEKLFLYRGAEAQRKTGDIK